MRIIKGVMLVILFLSLTSCGGGGGGGGDFVGAAIVSIDASPTTIDPGDRTELSIDIQEVHENGISLKIKFPVGLAYVSDSSKLNVDGHALDVGPTVNTTKHDSVYLVYYFSRSKFGEDDFGRLKLQLEASAAIPDGKIEIDADVDDPNVSNDTEFDSANPEFGAEDDISIEVID